MSTTTMDETAAEAPIADLAPAPAPDPDVTTFRGRTLEELLPQIREALGPDAVVVRQRDGLMGGIGGFFQQRFVEVEAKRGGPRIDVYDEQPPETPESFAQLLVDAESHADPIVTAAAFAPPVGASEPVLPESAAAEAEAILAEPAPAPAPAVVVEPEPAIPTPVAAAPEPPAPAPPLPSTAQPAPDEPLAAAAPALAAELRAAGMSAAFAERLLQDAEAHELPFAGGDLRRAVRRALARRIPVSLPYRAGELAVAFAGPGSTSCADALATTYVRAGRRAHAVATIEQARARVEHGAPDAVVALDLPPVPAEREAVAAYAGRIAAAGLQLDELLMVLPVELDLQAARALHARLAPLAPTGIALACDVPSAPLGAALELACATRTPLAFVLDGLAGGTIAPADPATLAERLLP